jgi:hypothetical protein
MWRDPADRGGQQSRRLYEVHRRAKVVATILRELREEDWFHVGD